ncbi:uncharacterized protein [Arachis hypogaea]|uniref:uncharacterized protein n=1 Tax=Arachis hypogaea TaxID=3818 RepID=UPI000DEC9F47|nr:uncharacterized protein LOC112701203 [Arachis hypogaea]
MAEKIDRGVNNGTAPPIFKLRGQNYHSIGSLLPPDSLRPTFAQLYIYDTENKINNRIGTLRSIKAINERDRKIVAILRNMLDKYNSLAKNFCYARDRYQQENCTNIKLKLISKRTTHGRTYNLPSASEVAALIVGDVEQLSKDRDIIIESQSRKLQRIDKRMGESLLILSSKRLFQQFLVDAYKMGESERYAGYLSYFITMTCNLEWDEIKREVTSIGLKAEDRLDILCQVFKIKLDCLIDDLKEGKIFGKILRYDIDKHITAKIPYENERPNLHGAVQNYMVHGPCGPYNKNSPCMKNGSCSKFYPKEFRQRTLIDEAEFPKYRCTDNATLYNAGDPSKATQVVDEIRNYYDCRYISACEAVWRLFGYEIQEKKPFVIRLSFHLEDEQHVVYGETSNVNDIVERAISHKSMFLGWMTANMSYPYARSLIYAKFPTKFVWKDDSSKWFPQKKGFAIGRLTHVPAIWGTIYATYRDACFALGLLQDDKEFIDAIKEASSWASGSYVRRLFVILLTSNNISRPEHVWDRCWHELSDDILYQQRAMMNMRELTMSDDEIKQLCLMDIATEVDSSLLIERIIREELNFNRDDLKKNISDMLAIATPEQTYAFDKIVTAVYCDEGDFFFVYGHGSTEKIFSGTLCLLRFAQGVLKLQKNMRLSVRMTALDQDETEQFGEWLLKVGDGLIGDNMDGESEKCLPGDIVIPSSD